MASAMTGAAELGAYGQWARAGGYQDVWFPDVPRGWAPYRNGYWGWAEPWGWTWVAEEPWGFAPFHYGRWRMIDDRWGWIPFDARTAETFTPVYAPALVTFFATRTPVAGSPSRRRSIRAVLSSVTKLFSSNQCTICGQYCAIHSYHDRKDPYQPIRESHGRNCCITVRNEQLAAGEMAARPARVAGCASALGNPPVRPTAQTAGISPFVARRFGIAQPGAADPYDRSRRDQQFHAPGPPIRELRPTPNARLTSPRTLARPGESAAPPVQQPPRDLELLRPGAATHHPPGSPVDRATTSGSGGANRPSTVTGSPDVPKGPAARGPERPPSLWRQNPLDSNASARPDRSPETSGRSPTSNALPPRASPPALTTRPPQAPAARPAAPPPATVGRAPPPAGAAPPRRRRPRSNEQTAAGASRTSCCSTSCNGWARTSSRRLRRLQGRRRPPQ